MHLCQTPFHVRRCAAVVVCVWLAAEAPQELPRVHVTGRARRPDAVQQPNMASHMRVRSLFVVVVGFAGLCAKVMHACRSAWVVSVRTCKVATHKHAFHDVVQELHLCCLFACHCRCAWFCSRGVVVGRAGTLLYLLLLVLRVAVYETLVTAWSSRKQNKKRVGRQGTASVT
jgi:hypothetical protein